MDTETDDLQKEDFWNNILVLQTICCSMGQTIIFFWIWTDDEMEIYVVYCCFD